MPVSICVVCQSIGMDVIQIVSGHGYFKEPLRFSRVEPVD